MSNAGNTPRLGNQGEPPMRAGFIGSMWSGAQSVAVSGFGKGLLITAAAVLGVMALVAGAMGVGAIPGLAVNGTIVNTLEGGIAAGLNKAVQFLTSGFGIATLGIGGALGAVAEVRGEHNKLAADEAQRMALELERARAQQKEKSQQKEHAPDAKKDTGIYVEGSMIKDKNFSACELKRRAQRDMHAECRVG